MFAEYIKAAMDKAVYEIIDDPESFYGEIPELQGIWASGKTLEACRDDLMSALEDWIAFRLRTGRSIPSIGGASIVVSLEPVSVVGQKADFVPLDGKAWPETQPEPADKLSVTVSRAWDVALARMRARPGR
jgi:predicted RNase H-like HicB family nuclease